MKATYIKPLISFDDIEQNTDLLAGSPHTQTGGTNQDGWTGPGYNEDIKDSEGDDADAKGTSFTWHFDFE